jgi:hypothetical protein
MLPILQPGEPSIALWVISHGNPPESIDELPLGTLIHNCRHVRLRLPLLGLGHTHAPILFAPALITLLRDTGRPAEDSRSEADRVLSAFMESGRG